MKEGQFKVVVYYMNLTFKAVRKFEREGGKERAFYLANYYCYLSHKLITLLDKEVIVTATGDGSATLFIFLISYFILYIYNSENN